MVLFDEVAVLLTRSVHTWAGVPLPEAEVPRAARDLVDFWPRPYTFDPSRFTGEPREREELVPQGGGDPATGHRCPGEDITVALLATMARLLAGLTYRVAEQDLGIPLNRVPTAPRSGFVITDVARAAAA
ncbi:hypothetical protein [Streptomyces brevispora]|uniref:Cytochrome P450 n=1 Tax=Streptomyces brevispora TaxID=887462 RepID=A0A561TU30_9ACTN|nr:hypothetical protein [Streptomyces brevispora]TWF90631.1 hypothetical protein FHX80_1346 [Streptomyces brevispora]WSC11806.1 hypothetical protein OIE64_02295 [Streptomyces brevispora]